MYVEQSSFLKEKRPVLKELMRQLLEEYPYASILAEDCIGRTYSVTASGENGGASDFLSSRGFVIRFHNGKGYGEYAFDSLSEDNIADVLEELHHMRWKKNQDELPMETPLSFTKSSEFQISPEEGGDEKILSILRAAREKGLRKEPAIIDTPIYCQYQYKHKLFLSRERDLEENILWMDGMVGSIASQNGKTKRVYLGVSGVGGLEVLEQLDHAVERAAFDVKKLVNSQQMIPGEYTCICSPAVSGLIAHESFGHGVEMDMFVRKRALAESYLGKRVASDLVCMHDSGLYADTGMYYFDDEGHLAQDNIVIKDGILEQGLCDELSAERLHSTSTGNGRRERFSHKAYARMTNTWFEAGKDTLEDMIASVDYGLLLDYPTSGMEDPKNWGIQCIVDMAEEIKDGKLTGKVFSPCILTGYVPDILCNVDGVSNHFYCDGSSTCGKGYKEMIKVSIGGPWIRTKIRLG